MGKVVVKQDYWPALCHSILGANRIIASGFTDQVMLPDYSLKISGSFIFFQVGMFTFCNEGIHYIRKNAKLFFGCS